MTPYTNGAGSVWLINTSGNIWMFGTGGSLYVDGSYGKLRSPGTRYDTDACCGIPEGMVFDTVGIGSPYGRISPIEDDDGVWGVNAGGSLGIDGNDVYYSYGIWYD